MFVIVIKDPYSSDEVAGVVGPYDTEQKAQAHIDLRLMNIHPDADCTVVKIETVAQFMSGNLHLFED